MATQLTRLLGIFSVPMVCLGVFGLSYPPAWLAGVVLLAAGVSAGIFAELRRG